MFAGRASELIHSVAFETVTLEVLQAQLLMSIHLLTDMQLNRCWANIGSLLRAAQALGLHLDPTDWNISPLEKELRKRLWWGIYWLDRYFKRRKSLTSRFISAKHGRPPAITSLSTNLVTMPTEAEDLFVSPKPGSSLPSKPVSSLQMFNGLSKLAHVIENIVVSLFKTPWLLSKDPTAGLNMMGDSDHLKTHISLAIEQECLLRTWRSNLPPQFRDDGTPREHGIERQRMYLITRYIYHLLD
jgi:hypothetical protein